MYILNKNNQLYKILFFYDNLNQLKNNIITKFKFLFSQLIKSNSIFKPIQNFYF